MRTRVVFVGGGSFVFGPSMLAQAILENRLSGLDLVLVDPNTEVVRLIAEVGRRMADSVGVDVQMTTADRYDEVLEGADFVICSAAVQMNRRFSLDREIISRHCPDHLVTEFGGVAGIASTLRQLALIRDLARAIKRDCPDAWLLDISNPLPRVCQMSDAEGVRTIGFCSVSISGYGRLSEILDDTPDEYPFQRSRERFSVRMGGTNHLSWLTDLGDRATGEDLMPRLRERIAERNAKTKCETWARRTGYFLMSGDDHVQDFLPPEGLEHSLEISSHGDDEDRLRRLDLLRRVANGTAGWEPLLEHASWERPFDVIQALAGCETAIVGSLNVPNVGQIPQLPPGAFVETECLVDSHGVHATRLDLPDETLEYSRLAVEINTLLVQAAQAGSLSLVKEAAERDPTIVDKQTGRAAIQECIAAHRDVIGEFV